MRTELRKCRNDAREDGRMRGLRTGGVMGED